MTHILLVEDNSTVLSNLRKMLESEGFTVSTATNGRDGIVAAQQTPPDLIICDIMMPDVNGYDVLATLRQQDATATVPFIFLTAKSDRRDFRQGMELGADDFLTKPFTRDELLEAIRAQLDKQKTLDERYRQQVAELRGNLAQSLPHRLLFPAIQIMGMAMGLERRGGQMLPEEVVDTGQRIKTAAKTLHDMIKKFLAYSELEAIASNPDRILALRQGRTTFARIEITTVCREIARQKERERDLQVEVVDATLAISDNYLECLVRELVENAFAYSPFGRPVTVTGTTATTTEGDRFHLVVKDLGYGMSSTRLAFLDKHQSFEQKLQDQGSAGLGLPIVRRLTELHGGALQLSSIPYEGTTVEVWLPVVA
ncbi:MAG: hybrid sensor histidine kinase/response regulator [Pseudanabaenaceae cyanobacterium]